MSKFKLSVLLVILAAFSMTAMAGDKVVNRVPAGAVAFHFVFDLDFEPVVPGPPEFVGYIAFIEGVEGSLFNGPPSKDTAYFTLRVTEYLPPPTPLPVEPDPAMSAELIQPGGQVTVYFNASPGPRDWKNPDTFSEGLAIAVFDESALMGTVANGQFPGVTFGMFSTSKVIDSTPIRFDGQRINFRRLVPNGVTITNFGNGLRFTAGAGRSGGGTAIAIGGKPRKDSYKDDSDD